MQLKSRLRLSLLLGGLVSIAPLAAFANDIGIATESGNSPGISVPELAASLPPLPPRNPNAPKRIPVPSVGRSFGAVQAVRQQVTIDVMVTRDGSATTPATQVDALGWTAAGTKVAPAIVENRGTAAGCDGDCHRQSAELRLIVVEEGALEPAVPEPVAAEPPPALGQPLADGGILSSRAVFDGIPMRVEPIPTEGTSSGDSDMAVVRIVALQPIEEPGLVGAPEFLAPVPPGDGAGVVADEPLTASQLDRLDRAMQLLQKPLTSVSLTAGAQARTPPDMARVVHPAVEPGVLGGGPWPDVKLRCSRYSTPFCHQPLYFEQPNFERCGESWGIWSPYVSAANFAGNIVLLPVHLLMECPDESVPTLGDCPTCYRFDLFSR